MADEWKEGALPDGWSDGPLKKKVEPFNPSMHIENGVPKWGRDNPNLYAATETALDLAPAVAGLFRSSLIGIPVAGAINAGAKYAQRKIAGEDTTGMDVLGDVTKGALTEGGGRIIGKGINVLTSPATANWLMRSAGKFGTGSKLSPSEQKALAQTMLDKGYNFTEGSHNTLLDTVRRNSAKVDDIYRAATEAGDTIPAQEVIGRGNFGKWMQRGEDVRGVDPDYKGSIESILTVFRRGEGVRPAEFSQPSPIEAGLNNDRPQMIRPEEIATPYTPTSLNVSKRQLYQNIGNSHKNNAVNDATETGSKELAGAIKRTLDERYPSAMPYNAESSELLNLEPYLARATNRISQRDVLGLGDKVLMSDLPKALEAPGNWMTKLAAAVLDRPAVKSAIAHQINKAPLKNIGPETRRALRSALEAAMYTTTGNDPLGIR